MSPTEVTTVFTCDNNYSRWLPELQELIDQLGDKLANKIPANLNTRNPTKVKEFKLTQPKPKSVPIPEEIPKVARPRTVSRSVCYGVFIKTSQVTQISRV